LSFRLLIQAFSRALVSTVPTMSCSRAIGVVVHVGADAVHQLRPDERIHEVHRPDLHRVRSAIMNSSTSSAVAMPPMPTIGIFTARRHS
jgi:hypothetical protein